MVAAMPAGVSEQSEPRRGQRLLVATWLAWAVSVVATPLTGYLMHAWVSPEESDDFGMGPFLSGVMLGGLLSVLSGFAALAMCGRLRTVRPLGSRALLIIERIVLISPPAAILSGAVGLVGSNPLLAATIYLGAAAIALLQLR
jgi:hypothetical protein